MSPDKPRGRWAAEEDSAGPEAGWRHRVPLPRVPRGAPDTPEALNRSLRLRISHRTLSLQFVALEIQEEKRCPALEELLVRRGRQIEREGGATRAKGGETSSSPGGQERPPYRALARWAAFPS